MATFGKGFRIDRKGFRHDRKEFRNDRFIFLQIVSKFFCILNLENFGYLYYYSPTSSVISMCSIMDSPLVDLLMEIENGTGVRDVASGEALDFDVDEGTSPNM